MRSFTSRCVGWDYRVDAAAGEEMSRGSPMSWQHAHCNPTDVDDVEAYSWYLHVCLPWVTPSSWCAGPLDTGWTVEASVSIWHRIGNGADRRVVWVSLGEWYLIGPRKRDHSTIAVTVKNVDDCLVCGNGRGVTLSVVIIEAVMVWLYNSRRLEKEDAGLVVAVDRYPSRLGSCQLFRFRIRFRLGCCSTASFPFLSDLLHVSTMVRKSLI